MKTREIYKNLCLALLIAGIIPVASALAASSNQVQISASRINYMQETGQMILEENVEVILDNVRMYADKVVAYRSKDSEEEFDKIIATGNVRIVTNDRKVFGQRAVFQNDTQKIRITGDPMIQEKSGNVVRSNAIVYDIKTNGVTFEGRAKVRMKITDKEKKKYSTF